MTQIYKVSCRKLLECSLKEGELQLDLRKKNSLDFQKSLPGGHQKSIPNIMLEIKKTTYFLKISLFDRFVLGEEGGCKGFSLVTKSDFEKKTQSQKVKIS